QAFAGHGLKVARNAPYAGGHTTQLHGKPHLGQHCVQVELDRSLYMDMGSLAPNAGFSSLSLKIAQVLEDLLAQLPGLGLQPGLALAAE
ncbi:MAG: N-formylglutamate amidohydrolase, partial [Sandaracinobacteroides sp.]